MTIASPLAKTPNSDFLELPSKYDVTTVPGEVANSFGRCNVTLLVASCVRANLLLFARRILASAADTRAHRVPSASHTPRSSTGKSARKYIRNLSMRFCSLMKKYPLQPTRQPPPKRHGPASRRPRPSAGAGPAPLSQPLYCLSARPTLPPYPAPQLLSPPSPPPSPDPLACDLQQLASVAVSAARRDSASSLYSLGLRESGK
jgi:hypothetical protein